MDGHKMKVSAKIENMDQVKEFVLSRMETAGFEMKQLLQVELAIEEIFINIVNYAYRPEDGDAWISCQVEEGDHLTAVIEFMDAGVPYDPLSRKEPDLTLSTKEREVGGLGIFLTKKQMDSMEYKYEDGKNILKIIKKMN